MLQSQKESSLSSHCLPAVLPFLASANYSAGVPSPLHLCPSVKRDVKSYSYTCKCKARCRDVQKANGQFCLDLYHKNKSREITEICSNKHVLTLWSAGKTRACCLCASQLLLTGPQGRRTNPSRAKHHHHHLHYLCSQSGWVTYTAVSWFCEGDQLLITWGAHIQTDGQHFLERSHDEGGLDGIQVSPPLCLLPLLVLSSRLGDEVETEDLSDSERHCLISEANCLLRPHHYSLGLSTFQRIAKEHVKQRQPNGHSRPALSLHPLLVRMLTEPRDPPHAEYPQSLLTHSLVRMNKLLFSKKRI